MLTLVLEWETSGETRAAFVQRHGLTLPRFDYWRQQLRKQRPRSDAPGFAPVRVVSETAATG